jgi:CTP:molybdopterin cytidylyltransferase MocA/HD superfamily phosphohydrolase YqeK
MQKPRTAAVILAAGYSSRMGRPKPLLDLDGRPVIIRVLDTFWEAGIDECLVVVGHNKELVIPPVEAAGARVVVNDRYQSGMFSSVQAGLAAVGGDVDAVLILPADIPLVRPATLLKLVSEFEKGKGRILAPSFRGKRGHPPLAGSELWGRIAAHGGEGGLKGALAATGQPIREVPICDSNVLFDMDSPEDYTELQARWQKRNLPSAGECEALWEMQAYDCRDARRHCLLAAEIADGIVHELNEKGCGPDFETVHAAALLHDLCRDRPQHAHESARVVRDAGFAEVASAIETHMDIEPGRGDDITAGEILYLADKLADGATRTTLAERLEKEAARYRGSPQVLEEVERRYNNARMISERIMRITGGTAGK